MRRRILPFILGGALAVTAVAPAAASNHNTQSQVGGAAGVVAAVVQLQVNDVDVRVLNNALNNVLRDADIDLTINAANNILQNADIDVTVTDITVVDGDLIVMLLTGDNQVQILNLGSTNLNL